MRLFLKEMCRKQMATIVCMLLMLSCGNTPRKSTSQQRGQTYHAPSPVQTIPNRDIPNTSGLAPKISIPESYEEGYIDGEAAAEEDRLAGHPGMQIGADDDEEDYEDGYDDGYEE